jgi:hypothetical protein
MKAIKRINKKQTYSEAMEAIQSRMTLAERLTSKVIHANVMEWLASILEVTIARPSAMLLGSFMAFIGLLAIYAYARFIGLILSGSETIVIFTVGWLIGITFDLLRLTIAHRH